jgi:molecular chaperone DnaJ
MDYYSKLGINKDASQSDIKKAYRRLAKEHHPDKGGDQEYFKTISEAYEVLSDNDKKANYDRFGNPNGNPYNNHGFDVNDFFSQFGNRRNNVRKKQGKSLRITIDVSVSDVFKSVHKTININREKLCQSCDGRGGHKTRICSYCTGSGKIYREVRTGMGAIRTEQTCPTCDGKGEVILDTCSSCEGKGFDIVKETISFQLERGLNNGDTFVVRGKGNEVSGGIPGDLLVTVNIKDDIFETSRNNLVTNVDISFIDAIKGLKKEVVTIDSKLILDIKPGVTHGSKLRIPMRGLFDKWGVRGDIYYIVNVVMPSIEDLSENDKELLEKFDFKL